MLNPHTFSGEPYVVVFVPCTVVHVKGHFKDILVYAKVLMQFSYKMANSVALLFLKVPSGYVAWVILPHLCIVCDVDVAQ